MTITEPRKILHVVSAMNRGGAESLLMNVYRVLDKSKVQFDFISHRNERCAYDDEILSLGGRIFRISSLGQAGPAAYIKALRAIMSTNRYAAVHAHTDFQSGFPALAAKLSGISQRICHSHSSHWGRGNSLRAKLTLKMMQTIIRCSATEYCACSIEAGRFLFGEGMVESGKVRLLKNGIPVRAFTDGNEESPHHVREELTIPEAAAIIGHIGTFSASKNHVFLLKILRRLLEDNKDFVAVLVGDGPQRSFIEEEAIRLGVHRKVRFLGVRSDVPRLMKAFDVFLFPSLFEGFGIVTLEAQSAGTPCVVSDTVPRSTDMGLGLVSYVRLDESLDEWSSEIRKALLKARPEPNAIIDHFSKSGFNITDIIPDWISLYDLEMQGGIYKKQ